jgi:hypothetical protein
VSESDYHPVAEAILAHVPAEIRPPTADLVAASEWNDELMLADGVSFALLYDGGAVLETAVDGSWIVWRDGAAVETGEP